MWNKKQIGNFFLKFNNILTFDKALSLQIEYINPSWYFLQAIKHIGSAAKILMSDKDDKDERNKKVF